MSASASSSSSTSSSASLLTPNEQNAFNDFLNGVSDAEWSDPSHSGWTHNHSDWASPSSSDWQTYAHLAPPPAQGSDRDALSKATRDLIASQPPPKFTAHRPIAPAPPPAQPLPLRPAPSLSFTSSLTQAQKRSFSSTSASSSQEPAGKRRRGVSPFSTPLPTKSTLLSVQQKKANHIQSEQKRRANIRRGYEALCDTIPALREAIRVEEESSMGGTGTGGRRRRSGTKDEEKVDGRAGPRSESVVLQKTIEHIRAMLDEKDALLVRLNRARSLLGAGHPVLYSQNEPLWEREWDGGKGLMVDVDGEQDSDEE